MPRKILIAPDKFKGTLAAHAAAQAIARGWRRMRPADELDLLPITDGGDGFGEVLGSLLKAKSQKTRAVDAAHRPCNASWWWEAKSRTAIIESARAIGLAMLPPGKFHPFDLDTFGLGAAIRAASARGAERCLIGIGGSATNDGGFGLARALGWEFLDRNGIPIEHWTDLHLLTDLRAPGRKRWFDKLIVAVDVQNLLLGSRGATRIYGPQKGLHPEQLTLAEKNLRRLAKVVEQRLGKNFARLPGAGAAGGLGFGLLAFLDARLESGFALFSSLAGLRRRISAADLVITGEGRVDRSTLMGKGVGELARLARQQKKIPCIAFAGSVADLATIKSHFTRVYPLTHSASAEDASANAARWLERLAGRVAGEIQISPS